MRHILSYIRPKRKSAQMAKERLQIIINHERGHQEDDDFLPQLRKELLAVISKYVKLSEDQINIQVRKDGHQSTIEMNVVVPH
jgi:cell division topological specificity factor